MVRLEEENKAARSDAGGGRMGKAPSSIVNCEISIETDQVNPNHRCGRLIL